MILGVQFLCCCFLYRINRHRTKTVVITPSLVYKNVRSSPEESGNVYTTTMMTEEPTTQSRNNETEFEETSHL